MITWTHTESYRDGEHSLGLRRGQSLALPDEVQRPDRWFTHLFAFTYHDGVITYWLGAPYVGSVDVTAEEAELFAQGLACPVPYLMSHAWPSTGY